MKAEQYISIIAGISTGILTGIIPGLHINTVSQGVLSLEPRDTISAIYFLVAMSLTHTIFDFIPGIFIGVPDEDTNSVILPAHRLVMRGMAYDAFYLTVIGSIFSIVLSLILFPIIFPFIIFFNKNKSIIPVIIFLILIFLIASEKKTSIGLLVTVLSGSLGYIVLSRRYSLFPMLTGFFGLSSIIYSLKSDAEIGDQNEELSIKLDLCSLIKSSIYGTLAGGFVGILPGLSSSQAGYLIGRFSGKNVFSILVSTGAINTSNFIYNIFIYFISGKTRSGVIVALKKLGLPYDQLLKILSIIFLTAGLSGIISLLGFRIIMGIFMRISYKNILYAIGISVIATTFIFTGYIGLFILSLSTSIGLICLSCGVKKSLCMSCIMIPVAITML